MYLWLVLCGASAIATASLLVKFTELVKLWYFSLMQAGFENQAPEIAGARVFLFGGCNEVMVILATTKGCMVLAKKKKPLWLPEGLVKIKF